MTQFKLNNGMTAKHVGFDDFDRPIMQITVNDREYNLAIVDNLLHTVSDYGEPIGALSAEYQLAEYDYDFFGGVFVKKGSAA